MDTRAMSSALRSFRRYKKYHISFIATLCLLYMVNLNLKRNSGRREQKRKFIPHSDHFHADKREPEIVKMLKDQRCKVPILNPFNPEIFPYLREPTWSGCTARKYGRVDGGALRVRVSDVIVIKLNYIVRLSDFEYEWSDEVLLLNGWMKDIDITHPLEGEFFKLQFYFGDYVHEEFHAAVLNPQENTETKVRPRDQLNVVMVLFDSVSDAHAQRSLPTTYSYLKKHPRTVIMKGHSIVGDGTTAQLCALLTGTAEPELPEARRGWNNSNPVDNWPWIFKNLHEHKYKSVYSEDDQRAAAFQYRLKGFESAPTTHYLSTLWLAMQKSTDRHGLSCAHRFHFEYLQRYLKTYRDYNKFAFLFNNIAHNSLHKLENADTDIREFYENFERSESVNNTVVIIMGDHGLRVNGFRGTLHGKLEERLPFVTLMLPPHFFKHRELVDNLKRNSHLLTTHFDLHSTLHHLMTFPKLNKNIRNKYGSSLFTDLRKLNRTCDQAGVAKHWCTCLSYEPVDPTKDSNVVNIAKLVVKYMNRLLKDVKDKCGELTLGEVTRAGRRTPSKEINQFMKTETEKTGCDSCKVKYDSKTSFSRYEYEINFSVLPSGGAFEVNGEVSLNEEGKEQISHSTDISRTNRYGDQPKCIALHFPHLRKYCTCKVK